ncbi:MAG: hypothetical protein DHS20C21_13610 [Gemmatimonadota bacterium]|nr:MAG: hypothetical protein DHS20C21_13610 [Gemmatimonadota bacterium]
MSMLNAIFQRLFDGLLFPFAGLPYWVGICVLGMLLSVAMLWVYKKTSNQDKIDRVKAQIHAGIFEIRLFNDSIGAIFRAQGTILKNNLMYFALALVPLAWMIIPMILGIGQLNHHYGYEGFAPGDQTMVRVTLADDWRAQFAGVDDAQRPPASLEVPAGLEITSPLAWFPSRNMLVWKVGVKERGRYELDVKLGDETYAKSLDASERIVRRSPVRHNGGLEDQILLPAESTLPKGSPVARIEIDYPANGFSLDVANRVWLMFLVSVVFAFAIKDRMGVKI